MLTPTKVNASPDRAAATQSTVIAGYALAIGRALQHRGIDAESVFSAVGLTARAGNDPLDRMTSATTAALYAACVEATQDPYFGLSVAQYIQASNIHALGHGLLASRTLLDACLRFQRNFALASQSASARVDRTGTEVSLRFRHLVAVCGESEDACLAFVINLMRRLDPDAVNPVRVEFRHACPAPGADPYEQVFGVVPRFGQEETALVWPLAAMTRRLLGDCPELAQSNDKLAAEYIARLDRKDVVARARAILISLMPSGRCNKLEVARALHMSPATLQSRLAKRGTSFSSLLDSTRLEVAVSCLSQRALSITEVAYRLGFADTSNFTRAFKRWTGTSPSAHRLASASPQDLSGRRSAPEFSAS